MNPSTTHSMYFVAIVCPPLVDAKVLQFKLWMKEQIGCFVALKSPAHITLIPPFWLEEARETELVQTLQSFKSDMDEQEIQLDGFSHFGKRVLFVHVKDNPALPEIKSQTEKHFMQSFGDTVKKDDRPFHPHVSIANRDMKPGDFEKSWKHFSNKLFKEKFRAKNISILKLSPDKWNVISERNW